MLPSSHKPVVAIDIDGTLAMYHEWFIRFAELYMGRELPDYYSMGFEPSPYHTCQADCKGSLWKHLHMSKQTYRQVKLAYRQGGLKRSMPAYPNAAGLTRSLRKAGAEVWIATTRPYLRLDNIDPDTRHWLRRNKIQFDGVLFGENKYRQLAKLVGRERVVGILDDLPELVDQARGLSLDPVLVNRPHNSWVMRTGWFEGQKAVETLFGAEELLLERVKAYGRGA